MFCSSVVIILHVVLVMHHYLNIYYKNTLKHLVLFVIEYVLYSCNLYHSVIALFFTCNIVNIICVCFAVGFIFLSCAQVLMILFSILVKHNCLAIRALGLTFTFHFNRFNCFYWFNRFNRFNRMNRFNRFYNGLKRFNGISSFFDYLFTSTFRFGFWLHFFNLL